MHVLLLELIKCKKHVLKKAEANTKKISRGYCWSFLYKLGCPRGVKKKSGVVQKDYHSLVRLGEIRN
jgi:hypothetical protein